MAESHNSQDETESDQSLAGAQPKNYQAAGDEFYERYDDARRPQRPNGQEGIGEGQEIFAGMFERPQFEDLIYPGHKKYEAKNKAREKERPTAV